MRMRPSGKRIALVLAASLAAACSFLKAHSDPTRYFVLTSSAPTSTAAALAVTIGLDHVELPEYLSRSELVTRSASNQLQIAEYEVWGEPLKEGFARTLRIDVRHELGGAHVVSAPFDPAAPPEWAFDVEVQRFERVAGDAAVLEARWSLRDVKRGVVVARKDTSEHQPVADSNAQTAVAALSRDVAALAAEMAAAVRVVAGQSH